MPFNGSGTFTLAEAPFVPNTTISSAAVNSDFSDIATNGLTNCVTRDGQSSMSAALPLSVDGVVYANDTNTGLRRTAADTQALFAGGTNILTVSPTGASVTGDLAISGSFTGNVTSTSVTTTTLTATNATISGLLTLSSTSHEIIPVGTTAQRPSVVAGAFRYNSDNELPEFSTATTFYPLSATQPIAGGYKGLVIQNNTGTPNTQVDVSATAVTVETSAGRCYRLPSISFTINCATTGANGLDAGSLANSTFYALYTIYNPATNTTAGLASTSFTSPTLPSGYTASTRVGAIVTNGSAQFFRIKQVGNICSYNVIAGGTTTSARLISAGTGSKVQTSLSAFIPSTAIQANLLLYCNGSTASLSPTADFGATTSNTNPAAFGLETANSQSDNTWMNLITTDVWFTGASSNAELFALGWRDNI